MSYTYVAVRRLALTLCFYHIFFAFLSLKEVTTSYFRVCIKDSAGYDGQRSKVLVDYLLFGGKIL